MHVNSVPFKFKGQRVVQTFKRTQTGHYERDVVCGITDTVSLVLKILQAYDVMLRYSFVTIGGPPNSSPHTS